MTDFQDLDILSLINDRPGWEIDMQDDEDLNISGEFDEENQIPNCFANDESLKSQSYANSARNNLTNDAQQDNGDDTDEYSDNSDGSVNENNDNDNDSNKADKEEANESYDVKNAVTFTSDEEAEDSDDGKNNDRNNSDEEEEDDSADDAKSDNRNSSDEGEEDDSEDNKSIVSKGSVDAIQEQQDRDDQLSDVSEYDFEGFDVLESDNEEVKEESDKGSVDDIQEQQDRNSQLSDVSENDFEGFDVLESDNEEVKEESDQGSVDDIQEQNDQLSDVSENEFDILESGNEEVKEESDKEVHKEDKEEENGLYDADDVIVVQLSDISDDESEKDQLTENDEDNAGSADPSDADGNDGSISSTDQVEFDNKEDNRGEIDESDNDMSIDDNISAQESGDDGDVRSEEDDKISTVEDHENDGDGDLEWSDVDENDHTDDIINDVKTVKEKTIEVPDFVDVVNEDSDNALNENSSAGTDEPTNKEAVLCIVQGKGKTIKAKKDIAPNEETDSPFGFVIGDVVGVSQEEFDRQDSSNVSVNREHLSQQEDTRVSVEKNQDNQGDGNQNNFQTMQEQSTAPMEVELTLPSVYPRVESYHSDNYLFGNAPIKQEPMDDDDYIQEHDYFDQSSSLPLELGLEAGELLAYQDMFDITATGQYKCKYCSAKLTTFKALKIHIDKCHQKSYKCQQCDDVFSRSQDLAGHVRTHRKEERITREARDKKEGKVKYRPLYKPRSKRTKNVVVEKDGKRLYRCRFCKKKFDMTQKLANHMQWKHKKERQREIKLAASLDGKHTVTQVSLYGAKMTIKMESLKTDGSQTNKDGSQRKQPVYSDTYECAQCAQIFYKQQAMAAHVRNFHSKQDKLDKQKGKGKSPPAVKRKTKKKSVKRKRRTISEDRNIKEESDHSDICSTSEEAVTPAKQTKREYVVHYPSLKCKLCAKTFREARELKSHLNGVHAQYCCRYCPKAFYKVEKFMCHSFQHLGDLRYYGNEDEPMIKCRKCKTTIPAKGEMTLKHVISHIKGKNPGGQSLSLEKQVFLECSECGQPFIAREFLFKHEMKHAVASGKVTKLKSSARHVTDSISHAKPVSSTFTSEPNGAPTYTNKYTVASAQIPTSSTTVTTRSEMVAHPLSDQTNITISGDNNKGDDNRRVMLRSQVLQTELISVTKIPFKCGMCEARFPNSQYLLHHMTLHMNGQYVFKIEVDKKKDDLLKESESSGIPIPDISSSKTTDTPATPPSSGNEMASSIVQQLSKGSNMATIINSNIAPESGALFNTNDSNNDHTYTTKAKRPSVDSLPDVSVTESSTNTPVIATPSNKTPFFRKKVILLPSKPGPSMAPFKPSEGQQLKYTLPFKNTTVVTPTTSQKLHEMLTKKEHTTNKTDVPNLDVVKLPTLGSMTASRRTLSQSDGRKDPGAVIAVEKKIRELLDVYKAPTAKAIPSSRGVQTMYTSLIYPKKVVIQKRASSTGSTSTSISHYPGGQSVATTADETVQSKARPFFSESNVRIDRQYASNMTSAQEEITPYSDTETLSAASGSSETGSPDSPVVGMSSESDSDELSEDEQALFETTTTSVSMPVPKEKQVVEAAHLTKEIKTDTAPHTPLPKVSIRNYKNQLDFAHGSWFECELCMYLCKTHNEFKSHLAGHKKGKATKLVKCSVCLRKFISKWHLSKHMETHRANAYSCSKCGANFRTSVSVMEHMANACDLHQNNLR